jgi:hypothetical protein
MTYSNARVQGFKHFKNKQYEQTLSTTKVDFFKFQFGFFFTGSLILIRYPIFSFPYPNSKENRQRTNYNCFNVNSLIRTELAQILTWPWLLFFFVQELELRDSVTSTSFIPCIQPVPGICLEDKKIV